MPKYIFINSNLFINAIIDTINNFFDLVNVFKVSYNKIILLHFYQLYHTLSICCCHLIDFPQEVVVIGPLEHLP